jgi:hypothetical protein
VAEDAEAACRVLRRMQRTAQRSPRAKGGHQVSLLHIEHANFAVSDPPCDRGERAMTIVRSAACLKPI